MNRTIGYQVAAVVYRILVVMDWQWTSLDPSHHIHRTDLPEHRDRLVTNHCQAGRSEEHTHTLLSRCTTHRIYICTDDDTFGQWMWAWRSGCHRPPGWAGGYESFGCELPDSSPGAVRKIMGMQTERTNRNFQQKSSSITPGKKQIEKNFGTDDMADKDDTRHWKCGGRHACQESNTWFC